MSVNALMLWGIVATRIVRLSDILRHRHEAGGPSDGKVWRQWERGRVPSVGPIGRRYYEEVVFDWMVRCHIYRRAVVPAVRPAFTVDKKDDLCRICTVIDDDDRCGRRSGARDRRHTLNAPKTASLRVGLTMSTVRLPRGSALLTATQADAAHNAYNQRCIGTF
jgi:hypothetical protein